jgi:alanine dehydrogenase
VSFSTLILSAEDVGALLTLDECIEAVAEAFAAHARGELPAPAVLGYPAEQGGFHIKAAALAGSRPVFAAKLNGNFPANPVRSGLPTIQGVVILSDATDGRVLAIMDSGEITRLRTGAATAVAARHLARPESSSVALYGCGLQGLIQLLSLGRVLPLSRVFAFDPRPEASAWLALELQRLTGISAVVLDGDAMAAATRRADVVVTCTPSRQFFLRREAVGEGTFIAAVGADDAGKQELEPALMAAACVVADLVEQCARIGDLHHALDAGVMAAGDVHAELGELAAGKRPGRTDPKQITVFDSTGTALQDVAAAELVYRRAAATGRGIPVVLGA